MGRAVFDHLVSQKMAPWWLLIFLIWTAGSIVLLVDNQPNTGDTYQLIWITGWVGVPSGILGFSLLRDRLKGKMDILQKRQLRIYNNRNSEPPNS